MKQALGFMIKSTLAGLLIAVPVYLSVLLLLKGMQSVVGLVRPIAMLLPDSLPAEKLLSLMLILLSCFLIGVAVRTRAGRAVRESVERTFREDSGLRAHPQPYPARCWEEHRERLKPALAEIEEAYVPAFIIEELEDGRYTVFIPSIPTPLAGAVYILERKRVHPLDVPFTDAIKIVSRWGGRVPKSLSR